MQLKPVNFIRILIISKQEIIIPFAKIANFFQIKEILYEKNFMNPYVCHY